MGGGLDRFIGDGALTADQHACGRLDPSGLFSKCQPGRPKMGKGNRAWWLLWMAEESACPPLASRKRGSDGRTGVWVDMGAICRR